MNTLGIQTEYSWLALSFCVLQDALSPSHVEEPCVLQHRECREGGQVLRLLAWAKSCQPCWPSPMTAPPSDNRHGKFNQTPSSCAEIPACFQNDFSNNFLGQIFYQLRTDLSLTFNSHGSDSMLSIFFLIFTINETMLFFKASNEWWQRHTWRLPSTIGSHHRHLLGGSLA